MTLAVGFCRSLRLMQLDSLDHDQDLSHYRSIPSNHPPDTHHHHHHVTFNSSFLNKPAAGTSFSKWPALCICQSCLMHKAALLPVLFETRKKVQ